MRILGIEGTAWAASAAIYDDTDGIVALESDAYTPESGGIHPREASEHMADALPDVIASVLADESIDAVAFSRGPGLGPCLRVAGTAARTIAQVRDVPLAGVNHMVAHLEIGRELAGFEDPICLNASGANAHVLGHRGGRYRVLGETMDTGIGNTIDKFARHLDWSHPGGPKVEEAARDGTYVDLPYVVKGMDFSFSGIMSAAKAAVDDGVPVEDVCCALQETTFAMVTEVSERALALTDRDELVLGGGVGQNERLQAMLAGMCADRGASFHAPPDRYLRDNAAMIALLGARMVEAGDTIAIEDSSVSPEFRPDAVAVSWRDPPDLGRESSLHGAEAAIELENGTVTKRRSPKPYRHADLDARLRRRRTTTEARLLNEARRVGVPTPVVRDLDRSAGELRLEHVGEVDLRDAATPDHLATFGRHLASLHDAGIVHGDPTVRNARVDPDGRIHVIDFGLGFHSDHVEDFAMDLHVAEQSLVGTVADPSTAVDALLDGYRSGTTERDVDPVVAQLEAIGERGRYR